MLKLKLQHISKQEDEDTKTSSLPAASLTSVILCYVYWRYTGKNDALRIHSVYVQKATRYLLFPAAPEPEIEEWSYNQNM